MKRLLIVAAIAAIAAPVFAAPELLPVKGMNYATYDMATGEMHQTMGPMRYGDSVWSAKERSGYYTTITDDQWAVLDWGDIAAPQDIGGFAFSYSTAELLPTRISTILLFFAEENGFNTDGRVYLAGFNVTDLPTGGATFNGWTVTVDLESQGMTFVLDGSDIDFDGLADFGYSYTFPVFEGTSTFPLDTGPTIAGDPNIEGPGMEDAFDSFGLDPLDPNLVMGDYIGSWWFQGVIFAQFYMELFDGNSGPDEWPCPNPGDSGKYCVADIDTGTPGDNCVVGLGDLARLLSFYGTTSGAEWEDGDVDPARDKDTGEGGDGDVDLGDLAELLSQYGDDCN